MSSEGMMRPYIVAAFFSNGAQGHMAVGTQEGVNEADATARLVAGFYLGGGKLPLVAMSVLSPRRDVLENALKMLDAIDAADKAEAAKVVNLVPSAPDGIQAAPPPDGAANTVRCKRDGHSLAYRLGGGECACASPAECADNAPEPEAA